jgi:hypothetical protein
MSGESRSVSGVTKVFCGNLPTAPKRVTEALSGRSRLISKLPLALICGFVKTPIRVLTCGYAPKVGAATWKPVLPLFLAEGVLVT